MKRSLFILAACVGFLAACSNYEAIDLQKEGDLVEKVIFEVLPIKDGDTVDTKASAIPDGSIVNFAWEATDTVGIYPDRGAQVYFVTEGNAGSSSISFDGGGWALKNGSSYSSYYPFVGDVYLERDNIPVSFVGQKQVGITSPFDGARYFLATEPTTSSNGILRFSYNTLNTIINVNATLPAGTYTNISLIADEPLFVEEGTYSLSDREIVGKTYSNTLSMDLEDVTLTQQATIPIYIMSAPVKLKDKNVMVRITSESGSIYKCSKTPSKNYEAGTRYGLTCLMQKDADIINFADPVVKSICIANWDTDGDRELDKDEAATVTDIGSVFQHNTNIVSFDEFQYFTGVTELCEFCFQNLANLSSIILPETLTTIGDYAFQNCPSLTSIIIPNSVTSIGFGALSYTGLTSLIIPDSVTELQFGGSGEESFIGGCRDLTYLYLGKNVLSFAGTIFGGINSPFSQCKNLSQIVISPENPNIDSRDNCNAIIETATNTLFAGCKGSIIPGSVTSIGDEAFANWNGEFDGLTSITIPGSVTSIGQSSFYGCRGLTSIKIPDSVTSIGQYAFIGCGLTSITIPDSVTSIGDAAFDSCLGLTTIVIGSGVTSMGGGVFSRYAGLSDNVSNIIAVIVRAVIPPSVPEEFNAFSDYIDGVDVADYPIYVPAGSVNAYKTALGWSQYADRIFSMEGGIVPGSGDGGDD